MRPFLKSYVGYGVSDDGVYFEAGQRSFELKDPRLFPLVTRLLRTLDGTRSTAAILATLPAPLRPLFQTLVSELDRNAMLQMVSSDTLTEVAPEVADRYRNTLTFLLDESPAGVSHFHSWRTQPLVVGGSGHAHLALLRGLVNSGASNILLIGDTFATGARLLSEHAPAHPGLTWRRISELEDAPIAARLLIAADDLSDPTLVVPPAGHRTVLAGGVYHGCGVAGSFADLPAAPWSMLRQSRLTAPYPASTLSVIGALVALEAIKFLLYAERTRKGETRWDEEHLFTITHAADIQVHRTGAVPAQPGMTSPNANPSDDQRTTDALYEPELEQPFDQVVGPFKWIEPEGREFPLPRRAILFRRSNGVEERVSHWALTPQQLDVRVVCKAAAAMTGSGMQAAPDYAKWFQAALADAIVGSLEFAKAVTFDVDPFGETDPALQMIVRLARLYSDAMPRLRVACLAGAPAFRAEACVAGVYGWANRSTPVEALVEALGDAISIHQEGDGSQPDASPRLAESSGPARPVSCLPSGTGRRLMVSYAPKILTPIFLNGTGIVLGRMLPDSGS